MLCTLRFLGQAYFQPAVKSKSAVGARGLVDEQALVSLLSGDKWKATRESLAPDMKLAVAQVNIMLKLIDP